MNRSQKHLLLTLSFFMGLMFSINAQDFHYSQFFNGPIHLNPALTGIFNGDVRVQGNYRSQWANVPVDYKTFTVAVDKKFIRRTDKPGFWSAGLVLNYDRAGFSRLSWADVDLNGSYTRYLGKGKFLTLGGQAAIAQRSFDVENLRFNEQYIDGTGAYVPGTDNGENFANTDHIFLDFGLGANFRIQSLPRGALYDFKDKRSKLDIGVGLTHLTTPDQSFNEDEDVPLFMRVSSYANGLLQIADPLDIAAAATAQFQGPYREIVLSGGLRFHINRQPGKQFALQGSVGYRFDSFGDAWYPMMMLFYNDLRVGFSYDINISDFNIATDKVGGPEISVQYIFKKVRPLPIRKFCPLI